jgi:hypothetical protein
METIYPEIGPLRRLRSHVTELKMVSFHVGADDRNRCLASVFRTATGRTMLSPSAHAMVASAWIRPLYRPPEGYALCYYDWKAHEYVILACLSGDERMIEACLSQDPYRHFARAAGLPDLPSLRPRYKIVCLGSIYGMTEHGAAAQLGVSLDEARIILWKHKETYPVAWKWLHDTVDRALANEEMRTLTGGDGSPFRTKDRRAALSGQPIVRSRTSCARPPAPK